MSLLTHGGRIVPILTGHDQSPSLPTTREPDLPVNQPVRPAIEQLTWLDHEDESSTMRQNKAMDHKSLEMPCLGERGLFALPTEGDGNCLYYSLSDQLYGTFDHGDELRQVLADHIASNKKYFMQFVVAQGGERRRPKRAAASAYATRSADVEAPSEEDKERRFEDMVDLTRKTGEWGSSEHLQAFCQAFKVDMNVYTMDGVQVFRDVNALSDEHRDVVHVAFHDFKHYSSVRPLDGSHKGLFTQTNVPWSQKLKQGDRETEYKVSVSKFDVVDTHNTAVAYDSIRPSTQSLNTPHDTTEDTFTQDPKSVVEPISQESPRTVDVFQPWDIQSIQEGLGGRYDRATIVDMLRKCRGDIDRAFAALLDENQEISTEKKIAPGPTFKSSVQASRESSPFSTGSKRSAEDSDDSEAPRPPIRRGRTKRRFVPNLTVGISFRDDQSEVVSLNLRMKADAEKTENRAAIDSSADDIASDSSGPTKRGPRRSGRLSKPPPV